MGFGAEMKDFISAFSTGKKLFERSPEEKERAELKAYTDDYLSQQESYTVDRAALPDAEVPQAVVSTEDPGTTEVSNETDEEDPRLGTAQYFAKGGPVEAIPTRRMNDDGEEGALDFTLNEADAGRGNMIDLEGAQEAFSTGLDYVANAFGLNQQSAVPEPNRTEKLVQYARGAGAADPDEIEGVFNVVDPKRSMPESKRMIASIWAGYKFYMERGEPEKAAKYAASMAQYSRARSMMLGNFALAALENGDTAGAAKLLSSAYNTVPDGRDIMVDQVAPEGIAYSLVGPDGKVTEKGKAGVKDLQRLAAGAATGQVFDQEAARVRSARASSGGRGGKKDNTSGREAIIAYKQAETQYNAAIEAGDEQAAAAAKQAMDSAYTEAIRLNSAWENTQYGLAGQKRAPGTGTQKKSIIRDADAVAQIDEMLGSSMEQWDALSPGGKIGLRNLTADIIDNNDVAMDEAVSLATQIIASGEAGDVVLSERGKRIIGGGAKKPAKAAIPTEPAPAENEATGEELGNRQADIPIPDDEPAFAKGGMVEDLDYWAEEKARKYRSAMV